MGFRTRINVGVGPMHCTIVSEASPSHVLCTMLNFEFLCDAKLMF